MADRTVLDIARWRTGARALAEQVALERWDGEGAVRLYARDDERHAMLLERCEPGTPLPDGRELDILIGLLPRLWCSGEGFRTLAEEAAAWAVEVEENAPAGKAREAAMYFLRERPPTQGEQVLVHTRTCTRRTCWPRGASRGS